MSIDHLIEQHKIVVIVRRIYGDDLKLLSTALVEGGIRLMEVTFDQNDPACLEKTAQAIADIRSNVGPSISLGAGTVLTHAQLTVAKQAGAQFIISPNTNADIIRQTKAFGLGSVPGAMTPSEMQFAHECGADFVKVFPYKQLGPVYMKEIMAPLSHIRFMATGSVAYDNFEEILKIGFSSAGIGSYLANREYIKEKRSDLITEAAKRMVSIVEASQQK